MNLLKILAAVWAVGASYVYWKAWKYGQRNPGSRLGRQVDAFYGFRAKIVVACAILILGGAFLQVVTGSRAIGNMVEGSLFALIGLLAVASLYWLFSSNIRDAFSDTNSETDASGLKPAQTTLQDVHPAQRSKTPQLPGVINLDPDAFEHDGSRAEELNRDL
jgi:hypothetical protein